MSKRKHSEKKAQNAYSSLTAWQILFEYGMSLVLFTVACLILFYFGYILYTYYRKLTNDESSLLFWFAQILRETLNLWIITIALVGWVVLTRYFICKPLRYLDQLVKAAEELAMPGEATIRLPSALKDVENSLNLVRAQALRNAAMAKEAEQRKNDLIVYLAHDLKTPLTSVIGYLTLLRDEPLISSELRARYTDIALDKALRLEDLINEFFDITRFNLTVLTLDESRVNLSRMLDQVTSEFLPVLAEKSLTWHTEIAPNIELLCDPDKLARVFDNLVRNAINYSYPETELRLSMQLLHHCPKDPDTAPPEQNPADDLPGAAVGETDFDIVLITLQNRGKTIPPDKLARIFEQFFRLDSSRSSATGGAGLGLAISKEIVELHGGTITAASGNEQITFTVKLPVKKS